MGHYDLYQSIGLDSRASSADLGAELSRRLDGNVTRNPGGADELQVARDILADPQRRAFYDSILADPNRQKLEVGGLRDIAAMSDFGHTGTPAQVADTPAQVAGTPAQVAGTPAQAPSGPDSAGHAPSSASAAATRSFAANPQSQPEQRTGQQPEPPHNPHRGGHAPGQPVQSVQRGPMPVPGQLRSGEQQVGQGQVSPGQQGPGQPAPGQEAPGQPNQGQPTDYKAKASATFNNAAEKSSAAVRTASSSVRSQATQLRGEYAKSSGKAIAVTAAATFLICLLIFGLISLFTGRGDASEREAASLAREFIAIEDGEEARGWLRDNASSDAFSSLVSELDLATGSVDYLGFAPEFGLNDAEVVQISDFIPFFTSTLSIEGMGWEEFLDENGYSYYVVGIGDGTDDSPEVSLVFTEVGGEMRLSFIDEPLEVSAEDARDLIEDDIENNLN